MALNGPAKGPAEAPSGLFASAPRDIFAGLISSFVSVAYGLSFAALIFAPPLNTWLAYGIAATFITSAVTAAIVAARKLTAIRHRRSRPHYRRGHGDIGQRADGAARQTRPAGRPLGAGRDHHGTFRLALTGVLLFGLGLPRAGGAIRFIPYPVWRLPRPASGVFDGQRRRALSSPAMASALRTIDTLLEAARTRPSCCRQSPSRSPSISALRPLGVIVPRHRGSYLLAPSAPAHLSSWRSTETSIATAEENGWLFKAPAAARALTPTLAPQRCSRMFPWHVPARALRRPLFAVMFVTAISTLARSTTGLEFLTKREADLQPRIEDRSASPT